MSQKDRKQKTKIKSTFSLESKQGTSAATSLNTKNKEKCVLRKAEKALYVRKTFHS